MRTQMLSSCERWLRAIPWFRATAALALLSATMTGCPGSLEDPDRFSPERLGLEAGACDPFGVMVKKCGGGPCHDATNSAAGLDLVSEGVQERLVGIVANHEDVTDPTACKDGELLINPQNVEESWMLKKINKEHNGCGVGMPVSGRFPASEKDCLSEWIKSFGGSTPSGGGGAASKDGGAG